MKIAHCPLCASLPPSPPAAHALPQPLRDFGYDLVAKYRYKVFGKVESCRVPTGDFKKRFIDYRPEEETADPISGAAA